jgi:cytochrome c oxidase subunit I+III
LLLGPSTSGMVASAHVYPAVVWLLSGWTAAHVAVGVLMLLYCIARRLAGRMTARHDIDIRNVVLYWHFVAVKLVVTIGTIAGFPLLA